MTKTLRNAKGIYRMLLENRSGLIYGVRNERSIAWGCAQSLAREGARLALAYFSEREEKDVRKLAASLPNPDSVLFIPCDLTDEAQMTALHSTIKKEFGKLDFVVHGVAFANKEDLSGRFVDTSAAGFALALNTSAYTFVAAARHAEPLLTAAGGGSLITLTYLGSERIVRNYNVMGVAKAALEASTRYLANDLGPLGIRVNAISPGPTMTLSARGISGFSEMYKTVAAYAPLRQNTTTGEVGDTAVYLASDLGRGVTGEVIHVDGGLHALAGGLQLSTTE
jgi:enoyl-[acyl-carrier protein] reductase I